MIPTYNRYIGNSGRYYRVDSGKPDRDPYVPNPGGPYRAPPSRREPPHAAVPHHGLQPGRLPGEPLPQHGLRQGPTPASRPELPPPLRKPPGKPLGGLNQLMNGILPFGLDLSDLLLLLMVFFLYSESGDEEFLIILLALGYSLYKSHTDQQRLSADR